MKKYLRLTLNERLQHFNLFINFVVLAITGFALKFPESWWVDPLTNIPGGMSLRSLLHRVSGVALIVLGIYHIGWVLFTQRGRGMMKDMIPIPKDFRDIIDTLKNNLYLNNPLKKIKSPRFNFREKFEYLGLIWGTLIMGVTGFILWFEVEFLKYFPQWAYELARVIHFYEAILAVLTIMVWHMYSVVFDPEVYPMNWSWLTGHLTEEEMEREHGLELEEIKRREESLGLDKDLAYSPMGTQVVLEKED